MKYFDLKKTFMDLRDAWAKRSPYYLKRDRHLLHPNKPQLTVDRLNRINSVFKSDIHYSPAELKRVYRQHLLDKYGKNLS